MSASRDLSRLNIGQAIPVDPDELPATVRSLLTSLSHGGNGQLLLLPLVLVAHAPATAEADGLEKLGPDVAPFIHSLIAFYLVGGELRAGRSLRDAGKALRRLHGAKRLPENIPTSHSSLSKLLHALAQNVFDRYFDRAGTRLLTAERGQTGRLSEDGHVAWELTRNYLERSNLLPDRRGTGAGSPASS